MSTARTLVLLFRDKLSLLHNISVIKDDSLAQSVKDLGKFWVYNIWTEIDKLTLWKVGTLY